MNQIDQESTRYLIIDGHSLIYTWDYLLKLHQSNKSSARENLIRRMTNYQDITGERVVIVFDGKGEVSESMNDENAIQVFYSKSGVTADQIRNITVASRDRAVLDTCSSFGADAISPKTLEELLEKAEKDLEKRLA